MSGLAAQRTRRLVDAAVLLGLAGLASLVVHQLAYLAAYPSMALRSAALDGHGHVSVQWAIIAPLAVTSAAVLILRQVRNLGVSSPFRARWVAAAATALFVGQEVTEGLVAGQGLADVAAHPAVVLGVLLSAPVSMAIVRLLRTVSDIVLDTRSPRRDLPTAVDVAILRPNEVLVPSSVFVCVAPPRGPPVRLVRS